MHCNGVCARSVMSDSAILWMIAHEAPLSIELSRQEYWSGLPFPTPGDLPDPGTELTSLVSALAGPDSLPLSRLENPISTNTPVSSIITVNSTSGFLSAKWGMFILSPLYH